MRASEIFLAENEEGSCSCCDGEINDLPTEGGPGEEHGLEEIPGGIGIDSCASDNVMARKHLPGYTVRPSAGSRRGQRWGCANGGAIENEGEVTYKFLTESGKMAKGTTQVGDVRRPLTAVSKLSKAGQLTMFFEGEDWIIDGKDPVVPDIIKLVQRATEKVKMYEHKGTYRIRAWLLPGDSTKKIQGASRSTPFGRQGR